MRAQIRDASRETGEVLTQTYQGLLKARQYGLQELPAVFFDRQAMVYGFTDLEHEHRPRGAHQPALSILRIPEGPTNQHETPAIVLSMLEDAYMRALRESLNDALP